MAEFVWKNVYEDSPKHTTVFICLKKCKFYCPEVRLIQGSADHQRFIIVMHILYHRPTYGQPPLETQQSLGTKPRESLKVKLASADCALLTLCPHSHGDGQMPWSRPGTYAVWIFFSKNDDGSGNTSVMVQFVYGIYNDFRYKKTSRTRIKPMLCVNYQIY